MAAAKKHQPAVLQNECHPYLQLKDLVDFCRLHNIQFQVINPPTILSTAMRSPLTPGLQPARLV